MASTYTMYTNMIGQVIIGGQVMEGSRILFVPITSATIVRPRYAAGRVRSASPVRENGRTEGSVKRERRRRSL